MMMGLLGILIAYMLGAIPFGYLLTRITTGKDVRSEGSGNIGATNVLRAAGRGAAVATLVLDMAKGFAAVWIAAYLTDGSVRVVGRRRSGGHGGPCVPDFPGIQGRQGRRHVHGRVPYLTPIAALAGIIVFVVTVVVTRYISAGSILAAATFPLGVWLIEHARLNVVLAAVIAAAIVVYRHKDNMRRIRAGKEPVFRWGA